MRIAEVVATFPPYPGGMGTVCFQHARQLARYGHEVTVFTLAYRRMVEVAVADPSDFSVRRLRTPMLYGDAGAVPQLVGCLSRFDFVHLHYPFYGGSEYVYLASLLHGTRYFLTCHMDVYGDTWLKKAILSLYEPLLAGRILRRASGIGVLSLAQLESSCLAGKIDRSKLHVLPNGVDAERFRPREKSPELVRRYGLEGKTVALFVGNLLPLKGVPLLIEAVAGIPGDDLVLLVVGGGYTLKECLALVRARGLEKRIIFAGTKAPQEDLPEHYNLGDFLVLPSTRSESFGLVVLEAFASGIPAIVSNLPGPSALVREAEGGFVARVGDVDDLREKILLLARQPELRRRMGRAGRELVLRSYDWNVIGARLEAAMLTARNRGA